MPQSMILQALRTNAIPSNFQGVEGGGKGTFINDVTHVRGRGSRFFQKVILGDQRGVGVSRKWQDDLTGGRGSVRLVFYMNWLKWMQNGLK